MSIVVGQRVLITKSNKDFLLGTVVKLIGTQSTISLDTRPFDPNTFVNLPNSLLLPINYWRMQTARTKYESLKFDPNEDPHNYFLSTRSITFDLAAVRAMWCWTNAHLFDYNLHRYPVLQDRLIGFKPLPGQSTARNTFGLFWDKGSHYELSIVIKKMLTMKQCFSVTVHEMVHQNQAEKREEQGHGRDFMKWAPAVKNICKVKLERLSDINDDERDADFTDDELVSKNENTKSYYVLMIHQPDKDKFWAVGSDDLELLEPIRDRYISVRHDASQNQVYLRKITNENLRKILKFITKPTSKVKNWTQMPENLSNIVIEQGKSVYASKKELKPCC